MSHDVYESPLAGRYASPYMLHLFSPDMRFQTWRRLWTALARAQHQLGSQVPKGRLEPNAPGGLPYVLWARPGCVGLHSRGVFVCFILLL